MDRNKAPEAAFAYVAEFNGVKFKLGRHHKLDDVRDGTEHDTVDTRLLAFALRTLDQYPISDEEKQKVRQHLKEHDFAIAKDPNRVAVEDDEDKADKIINQQSGGRDGNDTLKNPKTSVKMEPEHSAVVRTEDGTSTAQLVRDSGGGSIVGGGSTPTKEGTNDADAGTPKGDQENVKDVNVTDDAQKDPGSGTGTPAHDDRVSETSKDTSRPGVEQDGGVVVKTNPAINDPATVPTSKGKKSESGPRKPLPKGTKPTVKERNKKGTSQDEEDSELPEDEEEDKDKNGQRKKKTKSRGDKPKNVKKKVKKKVIRK